MLKGDTFSFALNLEFRENAKAGAENLKQKFVVLVSLFYCCRSNKAAAAKINGRLNKRLCFKTSSTYFIISLFFQILGTQWCSQWAPVGAARWLPRTSPETHAQLPQIATQGEVAIPSNCPVFIKTRSLNCSLFFSNNQSIDTTLYGE